MGTGDTRVAGWDSRSENVVLSPAGPQEGLCAGSKLMVGQSSGTKRNERNVTLLWLRAFNSD